MRSRIRAAAGQAYHRIGALGRRVLGASVDAASSDRGGDGTTGPKLSQPPWERFADSPPQGANVVCNVCRWHGEAFDGRAHVELSLCPSCGANGRDRFLHWCLVQRVELHPALRIIECSPRLGREYREAMATWFFYRTSDYDLRAHAGNLRLDLQAIDLPASCLDVVLCAHVLEHVPETDKALAELRRVLVPGGHLLLQVPVLQARTAPPSEPEFHGDDTPVFWRFGFDLTERLRQHGFDTALLCTEAFAEAVESGENPWPEWSGEFDVPDMLAGAIGDDLVVVADPTRAAQVGLDPAYMYLTWDCRGA